MSKVKKYVVGDSHRYEANEGIISMLTPCTETCNMFEIFCLKRNLFDDVERFLTFAEAEIRIKELFGDNFKFGK